jgi:prepilin peptidase CpaA
MVAFEVGWAYAVLAGALVVAAVTDLRSHKIYNWTTYPAIGVGLIGHTLIGGLSGADSAALGLMGALAGLAVGFVPLLLVYLSGGLNAGDVKLMAAVGALAGWRFALEAMFLGLVVAVVMAVIVLLRRRQLIETLRRVWQVLLLAAARARPVDPARADSPKIAFGFALCLGSAGALIEALIRGPGAEKILLGI